MLAVGCGESRRNSLRKIAAIAATGYASLWRCASIAAWLVDLCFTVIITPRLTFSVGQTVLRGARLLAPTTKESSLIYDGECQNLNRHSSRLHTTSFLR